MSWFERLILKLMHFFRAEPRPSERGLSKSSDDTYSANRLAFRGRRTVAIDCETTGLSAHAGDRIVTFAAVELGPDGKLSSNRLYLIFNPQRKSHARARRVHGYTEDLLSHQDSFSEHITSILTFLDGALLIGHNVTFDIDFLNVELRRCNMPPLSNKSACTLQMWRIRKPGFPASLDAVAELLGLSDAIDRKRHDALQDAALSLAVFNYLEFGDDRATVITRASEPQNLRAPPSPKGGQARTLTVEQAREACQRLGTMTAAARELGVSPTTIKNRLSAHER